MAQKLETDILMYNKMESLAQDSSLSVWRRQEGQLTYRLLDLHKLTPPQSRINNNTSLSLLCVAAAPWQRPTAADPSGLDGPPPLLLDTAR